MKPVVPQKRRSGFSIESIIGSTTTTTTTTSNNSNDNRDDDGADSDHIHSSKNIDRHVVSDRTGKCASPQRFVLPEAARKSSTDSGTVLPAAVVDARVPPPHLPIPAHLKYPVRSLLERRGGGGAGGLGGGSELVSTSAGHDLLALRSLWGLTAASPHLAAGFGPLGSGPPHPHHPLGVPHPAASLPLPPGILSGAGPRESLQHLYPWLLARHGHCFGYGFPGSPETSFLFHPYRKPKRIRTAFSPSQLLRLEHAFEKNHYVVGQERKELASKLSLTETQVKVWFQNRRTKYKRMKAEADGGKGVDESAEQSPGTSCREEEEDEEDAAGACADKTDDEELELVDSEDEDFRASLCPPDRDMSAANIAL